MPANRTKKISGANAAEIDPLELPVERELKKRKTTRKAKAGAKRRIANAVKRRVKPKRVATFV